MCFKKKTPAEANQLDRDMIEFNAKSIEALVVLAKDNEDMVKELRALQEQLKYLTPSPVNKIKDWDDKLKNKIGDLRIALNKADGEDSKKADDLIVDIKLLIADRNARV